MASTPYFNAEVDTVITGETGEQDIAGLMELAEMPGPLGPLTRLLRDVANDTVHAQNRLDRAGAAHDAWHAQLDAGTRYDPSTANRIRRESADTLTFWQSRLSLTGRLATAWKETKNALEAP